MDLTLQDDGIQELTIPPARTSQVVDGVPSLRCRGADGIWDVQKQVCVEPMEMTGVCKLAEEGTAIPPYMQVTIEDVQVRCGEMAKFHAIIEGNPQPTIAWFKGISLLTDSERTYQFNEGTSYSLILYNTRPEDGGVYTCIAKNTGGEVLCKAELVVQEDKKRQETKSRSTRRKLHTFYEVKQEIGRGSFGFLKRVVHKSSRASCAAKFIPLRSKTRDLAYQERDILSTLSHDRITQLLDHFETRKTLILILELCSNEELLDRLFRKKVVTEAEIKLYIKQLLEGIRYLHDNQVLHLDIKPPNILMVHDDRDDIKICDFGFAQKMNLAEPQYSKYGTPEFVSPEILSQAPVSMASDIWPVGVISYLSLTCKSPFAGENDRATLLNIQNGTMSWDIPDFVHLSEEAKDFIRKILQQPPEARPSALECLSHRWFVHNPPLEETHFIDMKQLKFFISRSKWQRSLMSYKSVLVMRPIPDILEKTHKNTSLGISRHLMEESSSSSTSGSSSDNEISVSHGRRPFGTTPEFHLPVLEGSNYPEYPQFIAEHSEALLPPVKGARHKQTSLKGALGDQILQDSEELMSLEPEAGASEVLDLASAQDKVGLLLPEGDKAEKAGDKVGRSPGCVPRHSVIKSTFYSQPPENLANVPSSPGKEHRKHLERAKRTYRKAGFPKSALSGLREPLLEQFEFGEERGGASGDEETGLREGGVLPLVKSASFDTAKKSPRVTFEVSSRSRSLDDYRMKTSSFAEEQYIEEEENESLPQGSPSEAAHQHPVSEACVEVSSEKSSTKAGSAKVGREEQVLTHLGDRQRPSLIAQQQEKVSAQQVGKEEDVLQKPKLLLPTKGKTPVAGGEGKILTSQPSDSASELSPKRASKEGQLQQTSKAPLPRDVIPGHPKDRGSTTTVGQPEMIPLASQSQPSGERGKILPHKVELTSVQSKEGSEALLVLQKSAPIQGTFKSGDQLPQKPSVQGEEQKVILAKSESPWVLREAPVGGGRSPLHQKLSVFTEEMPAALESKHLRAPVSQAVASADRKISPPKTSAPSLAKSAGFEGKGPVISPAKTASPPASESESQKLLHQTPAMPSERPMPASGESHPIRQQKPSAYSELASSILTSASPSPQTASQVETAPLSITHGESQKDLPPKSSIYSEAMSVLHEAKRHPQQAEAVHMSVPEAEHQMSFVPTERKPDDAFERGRQPILTTAKAGPALGSASESLDRGHEKPSIPSELASSALKGKRPHTLMASQAKTVPVSGLEAANKELLHHTRPVRGEAESTILKRQGPSLPTVPPLSISEGGNMVAPKRTPAYICEGRIGEDIYEKHFYTDSEAEALEQLVDEMVCLSKEMNVLAESVSDPEGSKGQVSPPREMYHQGPSGPAARPMNRYLVRRGKREGGIGLADPSETDVIYPGEEDYFSVPDFMCKKARMSPPYGGKSLEFMGAEIAMASQFASAGFGDRFYSYSGRPGSNRMYDIALVQIQDLSDDMPRPDKKTAKFDISEVEPAFLNLHELYDIVYSPFEFLSFRKAPENLPGKRRLPLGEKAKSPLELGGHLHQDKKMCIREDALPSDAVKVAPKDDGEREAKAPRMGKRSDSEGDIPVGSQQMYGLPTDSTGKRRSSLQSRLEAFKPFVRSRSMELVEQSLKKKVKASVTHLSRMLMRKSSSDEESREESEERRGDRQERASLTEASGHLKKKTGFSSFTLLSLKTKEKAPTFVEELTDQTIASGQSVTLSCRTSAHSSPRIEWFKDGAAIRSTDRILISSTLRHFQLLTILAATTDDFGAYTCVATNSQGTVSTSCVIRKAEAPSNPPSPDIVEILEDGVQLAWKPVELNTPVTYTVLCRKEDGEWKTLASDISNCCYMAKNLPRGLVCSFRIACVSKAGVGPYSNPSVKVKIGEEEQAAFDSPDTADGKMTAPVQATHQTYSFQTEIRRGRFSIIKQCREKLSGNPLAAKIVPYRQEDKEVVLQEYHILRKLHHTNIGQLQGAYVSPRHLVLIVELCVGPELLHALAGRASYSEVEVRDYLWQILSAVEYLHAQSILHLDLRSENMVITEPNLLKLLDFGSAQFYTPERVITLDGCTDYVETMASELLSDKGAVPQTDIWAIGVTAFIMLSAEYPISSEAACDFGRFVKKEKIKVNRCYAGLSGGAVSFLQSTLSSNPWRRPSASECLQSPWLQETGLDERQQATVTFSSTKLRTFLAERERKRALLCSKYGLMTV